MRLSWAAALAGLVSTGLASSPRPAPLDLESITAAVAQERHARERAFVADASGSLVSSTRKRRVEVGADGLRWESGASPASSLTVERVSIERAGWSASPGPSLLRPTASPTRLASDPAGGLIAQLDAEAEGAELSWTLLPSWPGWSEAGPVTVQLDIASCGAPRLQAEGVVFAADVPLHVSHVVAVDARGRRVTVPPTWDPGQGGLTRLTYSVPDAWLREALPPVVLDPVIGPEHAADPDVDFGSAAGDQGGAVAAFNGTDWLVAWTDDRATDESSVDLLATRVSQAGVVLDPSGILVCMAPGSQGGPAVASNGGDFLVAWTDSRNLTTSALDIYAGRISATGAVLDPGGFPISTAVQDQSAPSVAFDGASWLVAWEDLRDDPTNTCQAGCVRKLYATRVRGSDGALLDGPAPTANILVAGPARAPWSPSVAAVSGGFLVAWQEGASSAPAVRAVRLNSAGTRLDATDIAVFDSPRSMTAAQAASDGTNYLITWFEMWLDPLWEPGDPVTGMVEARRVDATDGSLLGGVIVVDGNVTDGGAAVAGNATGYLVAWPDSTAAAGDIVSARVSPAGVVLDATPVVIARAPASPGSPRLAASGTDFLATWTDDRDDNWCFCNRDAYAARIGGADGQLVDGPPGTGGILLTQAGNAQQRPAIASNGSELLVAWTDTRGRLVTGRDIHAMRLALDGAPLDATSTPVVVATGDQTVVKVAAARSAFLVAWMEVPDGRYATQVACARVAADGTLLDLSPIVLANGLLGSVDFNVQMLAVASNGTDWLACWLEAGNVKARRVHADGSVDPGVIDVTTGGAGGRQVCAASNDRDYAIVYEDSVPAGAGSSDILLTRVAADGRVLDPAGIPVSAGTWGEIWPVVGSNGRDWLVAWQDYRDIATSGGIDIYAARVAADGVVRDPSGLAACTAPSTQQVPVVTGFGADYMLAWMDLRSGDDRAAYAGIVRSDGSVDDVLGSLVEDSPYHDGWLSLASGDCGQAVLAYQRFEDDPAVHAQRVFTRTITADGASAGPREVSSRGGGVPLLMSRSGSDVVLAWEDLADACVSYDLYEGTIESLPAYDHASRACHVAGVPDAAGRLQAALAPGAGNRYYLVTASDFVAEGTAGTSSSGLARDPARLTCGPHP